MIFISMRYERLDMMNFRLMKLIKYLPDQNTQKGYNFNFWFT